LRDVLSDQETMENRADLAVTRLSVSKIQTALAAKDRMRNDFVPASQAIRPKAGGRAMSFKQPAENDTFSSETYRTT
jgi:hypothetical protein